MTGPSWQQVAATLANPRLREVYAKSVLDMPSGATRKELKKLVDAGLLHDAGASGGQVDVNEDLFATLLASQQSSQPSGPDRFFHHGRITSLPRKEDDRDELLAHLSVRLFPPEDVLDEYQVNLLLRTVASDVPSLRRAMVDYGHLKRSTDGSQYWRAA